MRMLHGIIHVVTKIERRFGHEYWRIPCRDDALFIDGGVGVRVGKWTYPTCLECAAR